VDKLANVKNVKVLNEDEIRAREEWEEFRL